MRRELGVVVAMIAAVASGSAQPAVAEWPQLFGPSRNAHAAATIGPGSTVAVAWRKPLPSGGAGVVVAGNRLYTLGTDGERDILFALDPSTGEESWRLALGATHTDTVSNGPSSTPAVVGNFVMTVSTGCLLQAVNIDTRTIAWTQDIGTTYASQFVKRGGCGMAPLAAGARVILPTGSSTKSRLAAFDVATGKPVWEAADLPDTINPAPGWANEGGGLVLYHHFTPPGVSGITAIDATTGTVAWRIEGQTGQSDATPVSISPGRVLIETWPQVSLYDVATRTALWTSREIAAQRGPAIARNQHLYTFGGQSGEFLTCLEVSTGRVAWTSRIYRGHLALAGDTLVVLSEASGLVRLVAADPSGYRELAKVEVLSPGARTGTPPSVAGGRIFVRNLEELVAVEVK